MIKKCCVFIFLVICAPVNAWELSQVKINHVQISGSGNFYLSVDASTGISGCSQQDGWVRLALGTWNAEVEKAIMSFALSAQVSGTLVDVGGPDGCLNNYAQIKYIRVGNYRD